MWTSKILFLEDKRMLDTSIEWSAQGVMEVKQSQVPSLKSVIPAMVKDQQITDKEVLCLRWFVVHAMVKEM